MKNKGFAALILIVVLLSGLIVIYYFKSTEELNETTEIKTPSPEEVVEANRKIDDYLDTSKESFLKYLTNDFDTTVVVERYEELKGALAEGRVYTNVLTNIPVLMRESMLDSVITQQEADGILDLMEKTIERREKQ